MIQYSTPAVSSTAWINSTKQYSVHSNSCWIIWIAYWKKNKQEWLMKDSITPASNDYREKR